MDRILHDANNAQRILKLTADTMLLVDRHGVCVDIEPHCDLWFLQENILLGKNIFELLPEYTKERVMPIFQTVLEEQRSISKNFKLVLKDEIFYFKCLMFPYDGMVLCQYRDITQRSNVKRRLEQANLTLRAIQKIAQIGQWAYNTNQNIFHYLGYTGVLCEESVQNLAIEKYVELIVEEDRQSFIEWCHVNEKELNMESISYRVRLNGEIFYMRIQTYLREERPDGSFNIEGYIQNITDIQHRRNDINTLTHAINNAKESIFAARPDGTIIFANRRFLYNHGISENEDISQLKIYNVAADIPTQEAWDERCKDVIHGGSSNFVAHHPSKINRDILAYEGTMYNVTELEMMKRELLSSKEKAEMSDSLKSAFLANMSHEIRTPLNAIVGFSHLIAESDDAEERKTYYNIVNANNERLLQLINEILDLSKIESGTIEFSFGPASLHNLCREVYDAHIFRTPQGVSLVYEPSDESLMIETDKNRVFQVISNLIGNAVKFTKEGSISYGYKLVDNQIVFHVTDTGTGIEPEKVGRVFERFAKLNNHAQGTGLGLSICKSIVERLGGKISVSSEFGKGTTFTFTLPYTVAESVSVDSEKKNGDETSGGMSSAVNTRHACILVAEDTDSNFDLLEAILGKEHRIIRAHDGMEVVTMFDEVKPDLILMDIKMPNLDGLEATKIIRELSATVPIIAQSAFAYEQDRKAAKEAGCNDFIAKPIADDKLKAMIHKWLSPP